MEAIDSVLLLPGPTTVLLVSVGSDARPTPGMRQIATEAIPDGHHPALALCSNSASSQKVAQPDAKATFHKPYR